MSELPHTQVIVIGAGFSGLAAARKLMNADIDVSVLEANNRVGGRIWDPVLEDGRTVLLGGQWFSEDQERIWSLGQEFNLTPFSTTREGDLIVHAEESFHRLSPEDLNDPALEDIISEFETMAETVPLEAPWKAPRAQEWDSITMLGWLAERLSPELLEQITPTVMGYLSMPEDLSLLHALFYTRANGGFGTLFAIGSDGAHDTHVFAEGAQRICEGIGDELEARLRLNSPVYKIRQNENGVQISGENFTQSADKVIIAMPPALSACIRYTPPLPAQRNMLTQRTHLSGRDTKFILMYEKPFWREAGLSGMFTSTDGPVHVALDCTPGHERWAVLAGFVNDLGKGRMAMDMSEDERRTQIVNFLSNAFGQEVQNYVSYHEHDWAGDDLARGCVTVFSTSAWSRYGPALRKPVGNIHWAGTETATNYPGQMEGAVRAGERAADEIISLKSELL